MRVALAIAAMLLVSSGAAASPRDGSGHRIVVLGRSVDGRTITAVETGDFDSPRKALVVGCVHGDECAGIAAARALAAAPRPNEVDLWIVPDLNPDGRAAGTRQNARGVDLNRNFPWRWQPLSEPYYSGRAASSEPETRIAMRLIGRTRPAVSIWFHQHLDVVDDSTGSVPIERRFAQAAGMTLRPLTREPGSAVSWQTHCFPSATAFVVELPAGATGAARARTLAAAVLVAVSAAPERAVPEATPCASGRRRVRRG